MDSRHAPRGRATPVESLPRLRRDFGEARRIAAQAVASAAHLAERTRIERRLLLAMRGEHAEERTPVRGVWELAAREIARVTGERDRGVATVAHEGRQPLAGLVAPGAAVVG